MDNIIPALEWVFFGDFGLLTLTPRYLFLVLFPIMTLLEIIGQILPKIPFLRKTSPLINEFFYGFIGLGCTTVAIMSLNYVQDRSMSRRMIWILILLIPCSSQLAIIATFAAMVSLHVFLVYLLFCIIFTAALRFAISRAYPLTSALVKPASVSNGVNCVNHGGNDFPNSSQTAERRRASGFSHTNSPLSPYIILPVSVLRVLIRCVRNALKQVIDTALPFCAGSIIISLATSFGLLDRICELFGPLMQSVFGLPPAAAGLLVLNVLKRDFGSASLLSGAGGFDAVQMTVILILMTFSVPCFNSTILLVKQQKLPASVLFWLGSLIISLFLGFIVSRVLAVCFI